MWHLIRELCGRCSRTLGRPSLSWSANVLRWSPRRSWGFWALAVLVSLPGALQPTLLCHSPQPDANREASLHVLESAKGLDPPEAAVCTPARFWLGTPEQGRTPRSMLVSGRRICPGKRVGFVLFNSILAQFVLLKYLEMAWRSPSMLLPRPCSCLGLHSSSSLNLNSGGLSPPKTWALGVSVPP